MTTNNQISSAASLTAPIVGQNRLVIVGATGMVGGYALRYALDNSEVKSVTSIGRKTAWHLASEAGTGSASELRKLFPARKRTLEPGRGGLLPGDLHRVGIGRATTCHNRRLYDRVRASVS